MRIVTDIILPGGWHYKDQERQYRIPLKGELPNAKAVIDAMMSYRLENNLPVNDPEGELVEYVCEHFPTWCRADKQEPAPPPNKDPMNQRRNVDLVAQWANALYTQVGYLILVPQEEAEQRAQICASCPLQMNWVNDCPPCVTSAQRILAILRQGKDTSFGQKSLLHGCNAHGWDNRTAVHVDNQHLPPQANPNAPANCWMRKPR